MEIDSVIESMSSLILSNDTTELSQTLTVGSRGREGKLGLLKDIHETHSKITSKLNEELANLSKMTDKTACTQNYSIANSLDTVERLMEHKKKVEKKIAEQADLKRKKEDEQLKSKPVISSGTQKLIKSKKYIPIYVKERLQEIENTKTKKLEKLRLEVSEKRRLAEEQSLTSVPYKGSQITNIELCFDPSAIRPMVYQAPSDTSKQRATSEEEELKKCSFRPRTDRKSEIIFAQKNQCNRSVVERLTDYGKHRQEALREKSEVKAKPKVGKRNEGAKIFSTKPEETNIDEFVRMVLAQVESAEEDKEKPNTSVINKYLQ
eukprot:TRINITY_DN1173_c0_g2_i1.p1 TRINITY_DN1173_c0_g2~~TRINITY_DN1173_c0_g2_i1.p1  ORF type:complete len:375 (-),score=107.46 TRINITY_DN1173_c0_g2_i1:67-1026(-)